MEQLIINKVREANELIELIADRDEQLIMNKVSEPNELIKLIEDRDEQLEVQQHQHDEQPRRPTDYSPPSKHNQQVRR
jgi:uncharacterized membrane protein YjjP (DUF1212 family)